MLLSIDSDFAKIHNCRSCEDQEKIERGCTRPVDQKQRPNGVWKITNCFACHGENSDCAICRGNNEIPVFQCPRALATRQFTTLLPYFFEYYAGLSNSGIINWPDGKPRLKQPIKLIQAFDMMASIQSERDKKEMENIGKGK